MKTIAMCALLAALAFGLLPGNRDEAAAPDEGLVLLDEAGTILSINPAAQELFIQEAESKSC